MTLKILYPLQVIISLAIIILLSAWVTTTESYVHDYDGKSNPIHLPGDLYTNFVLGSISIITAISLTIPNITRRFGYSIFALSMDIMLALSWLIVAIYTTARATNGSFIDSNVIMKINFGSNFEGKGGEWINKRAVATKLGCSILALEWITFITWTILSIILFRVRSRRWANKNSEQNKRITICSSYNDSFDEDDAKMLTTPKIKQKIDDLLKNPESTKQSNRVSTIMNSNNSEKKPIVEMNSNINSSTTKTYSLTNSSTFSPDYYTIALNDINEEKIQ
ncbi:492_t:CDS:1 [Diversispora eburnea]|uniref:492_t:CDS:1 n=1 Tax=Diversispora eburnea TaxID=1213867 RepID=A0A9N8V2B2_9GLOM|nr:492_t:CDS:1 [Diversispora eburnea]